MHALYACLVLLHALAKGYPCSQDMHYPCDSIMCVLCMALCSSLHNACAAWTYCTADPEDLLRVTDNTRSLGLIVSCCNIACGGLQWWIGHAMGLFVCRRS